MRRWRGVRRGQAVWLLLAAASGYLIGNWNASPGAPRSEPTSGVALRFQEDFAPAATAPPAAAPGATLPVLGSAQLALFAPQPVMADPGFAPAAPPPVQAATTPATSEIAELTPAVETPAARPAAPSVRGADTSIEAAPRRLARRPDGLFDDAELARIKRRLHLSADQERMWPAVAVALRRIAHEQKRKAQWHGGSGGIDPNSDAVQDLKSAAMPLLMSFSDAQKDEVRHLAHNMGLDQLAAEF